MNEGVLKGLAAIFDALAKVSNPYALGAVGIVTFMGLALYLGKRQKVLASVSLVLGFILVLTLILGVVGGLPANRKSVFQRIGDGERFWAELTSLNENVGSILRGRSYETYFVQATQEWRTKGDHLEGDGRITPGFGEDHPYGCRIQMHDCVDPVKDHAIVIWGAIFTLAENGQLMINNANAGRVRFLQ
jgi:hypothetical protein